MKIVGVVNSKGGVGKSTLTRGLGCGLVAKGLRVAILDVDVRQKSSMNWYGAAQASGLDEHVPTVMLVAGKDIDVMVEALKPKFDVILIDTIGTTSGTEALAVITNTIKVADLVLLPLNPGSADDLDAVLQLDPVIRKAVVDYPQKQIRYLLSKMNPRNTAWEMQSAQSFIEERELRGLSVMSSVMYSREQYLKTIAAGISPIQLRKSDAARLEVEGITSEVMDILGIEQKEPVHG